MSTIPLLILFLPAFILFNFFYWKSLNEDYVDNKIFLSAGLIFLSTGLLSIAGAFLGGILVSTSIFQSSGLWFWGGLIGFIVAILVSSLRLRFKLNEIFDAGVNGLLWFLAVMSIGISWVLAILFVVLLGLYYLIKFNYKKFTIYKSGKIGVAGIVSLGVLFAIRAITAIFLNSHMLSLIGKIDGLVSAVIVFILFLALYRLSEVK